VDGGERQRGEAGDVFGADVESLGAHVLDDLLYVDGVPQDHDVEPQSVVVNRSAAR
jgi:hypothetical protein